MSLSVAAARTAKELSTFIDVGVSLQRAAGGAPQPREDLARILDRRRSPVARDNVVSPFVAFRDGVPIGRIVAIRNAAHLAKYEDGVGHFGLLDAVDDRGAIAALVDAAAAALVEQGLSSMRGPFNLSINHESGLLISGFDQPHTIRTNYAPPYISAHLEALGFRKAMDLTASACRVEETDFPERVARRASADPVTATIRTRGMTHLGWKRDFAAVLDIYNDAWAENWGAVLVSPDEGRFIAALTLPIAKPAWIRIADVNGIPIAVVAQIPNVNEALHGIGGRLMPFGWISVLDRVHRRGTRMSRLAMVGVSRAWRGTPTGSLAIRLLLAEAIVQARTAGVYEVEISWMLETNHAVLRLSEEFGAFPTKIWRIYEKSISSKSTY